MLAKNVKVGEEYAMHRYGQPDSRPRRGMSERDAYDFARRAVRVRVLEVGVNVGYARPGASVLVLDSVTGEPARTHSAPEDDWRENVRYVGLVIEWEEWASIYADTLEEAEEKREAEDAARVKRKAEAQERAAVSWMERTFASARQDLDDVAAIGYFPVGTVVDDLMVKRLVDHRHPNGNPYLNGERTAHA